MYSKRVQFAIDHFIMDEYFLPMEKQYHLKEEKDSDDEKFCNRSHPWKNMDDEELLKSAGLYGVNRATGEKGYNLAAIMLLGKDDVILDVAPTYEADALLRKVNVDRYDDREIVRTNLIESYDRLMEFARKHLPDKFFLENANRSSQNGFITPDNLEPNPKNPLIASFFRNIGRADKLGSGVHKLFKYTKYYSGKDPVFQEGDVFRIIVPLDDEYSFDYALGSQTTQVTSPATAQTTQSATQSTTRTTQFQEEQSREGSIQLTEKDTRLLKLLKENPKISQSEIAVEIGWDINTVKYYMTKLKKWEYWNEKEVREKAVG